MPIKFRFIKSTGILLHIDSRTEWNACSGGTKCHYIPLSNGHYTVPANALMTGRHGYGVPSNAKYKGKAYTDPNGFSWFLWLGKGNLGIHPDGNVPGTKGCIGVTDANTRPLFNLLRKERRQAFVVEVLDHDPQPRRWSSDMCSSGAGWMRY